MEAMNNNSWPSFTNTPRNILDLDKDKVNYERRLKLWNRKERDGWQARSLSDTEPRYQYQPLSDSRFQIRLLRLDEASINALDCTLHTFDFESVPQYYALSYVWGPVQPARKVMIDRQALGIGVNLSELLCALIDPERDPFHDEWPAPARVPKDRWIWVDAICIDQSSDGERSRQVARMGDIYSAAEQTIVWLGHHGADEQEYWMRLWIVQEVVLASSLAFWTSYGRMRDDDPLTKLDEIGGRVNPSARLVLGLRSLRRSYDRQGLQSIDIITWRLRNNKCKDPRDRVYALMHLPHLSKAGVEPIVPDYRMTVEDVWLRFVKYACDSSDGINNLGNETQGQSTASMRETCIVELATKMGIRVAPFRHHPIILGYLGQVPPARAYLGKHPWQDP